MNVKNGDCEPPKESRLAWIVAVGLVLLLSLGSSVSALSLESGGSSGEETDTGGKTDVVTVAGASRVKRSRDVQQLCGYRLLDALRSVCDRNFVGFTRRSDPNFIQNGIESGEEFGSNSIIFNADSIPWEVLALEYPKSSSMNSLPSTYLAGEIPFPSSTGSGSTTTNPIGDGNLLDYLELLQNAPGSATNPVWRGSDRTTNTGGVSNANKAFALKMLAEPPKSHQRFRRNIIDECCKKPCAIGQMLKYCAITNVGKRSL